VKPLWKILAMSYEHTPSHDLTCTECYSVLEYLADQAVAGANFEQLSAVARRHLARCPDCQQDFAQRLAALEESGGNPQ
jgi:hypothetical protein